MNPLDMKLQGMLCIPRIYQLGIVVRDIENAVAFYSKFLCVNPWYRAHVKEQETFCDGKKIDLDVDTVFGYSGRLMVRLVKVKGGGPNVFTEHLDKRGEGLHHLGFEISDFDRQMHVVNELGIRVLQSSVARTPSGAVSKSAYLDTVPLCGYPIALMETRMFGIPCGKSRFMMKAARLLGDASRVQVRAVS